MVTPERHPFPVGRRGATVLGLLVLGLVAGSALGLDPRDLVPRGGGAELAADFLSAAVRPALDYEGGPPSSSAPPFLALVAGALGRTLAFALAAMSIAIVCALPLALLASTSWWSADAASAEGRARRRAAALGLAVQGGARLLIAGLRSVHELLWAVVLLAAVGLSTGTAVLAIAIPYTGVLAKVFSEMLDEASPAPARALAAAGAAPVRTFLVGRLPRAAPDMAAYAFYRFECAVRSSAVLGFFGYETLGYHLHSSFDSLHHREVWTYLWVMLAVVFALEAWSAALRRRFVA
jgi:phosphonate transport system permease protein